jgi:pyruvyl transferase EpsI
MNVKKSYYKFKEYIHIRILIKKYNKKVFLIGTPWYGNLGDQAITLGEKYILKECFKGYNIIEVPYEVYMGKWRKIFGLKIKKNDVIFLQGGGNLGSLYLREENLKRDVIKKYKKIKLLLCQLVYFFMIMILEN